MELVYLVAMISCYNNKLYVQMDYLYVDKKL